MNSKFKLKIFTVGDIEKITSARAGETKAGQAAKTLQSSAPEDLPKSLKAAVEAGARYAVILIPEDIGPRANLGRAGSHEAPDAFMNFFVNMQANRFFDCSKLVLIGAIDTADLMAKSNVPDVSVDTLRQLCADLDTSVAPVLSAIVAAGLEPIVIGGGNNNSFPVIQGVVEALRETGPKDLGLAVVNCDPHADFRQMEGRHSGNPFTFAHHHGYLKRYCVFGLHENYNSEEMLERLQSTGFPHFSFEDFAIKRNSTFAESIEKVHAYLSKDAHPVGCEVDLDSIRNMPASAKTPFGITQEEAAHFVFTLASRLDTLYLHLSEAAPKWGGEDGARESGKCMALLVMTYVKAREQFRQVHGDVVGARKMLSASATR